MSYLEDLFSVAGKTALVTGAAMPSSVPTSPASST